MKKLLILCAVMLLVNTLNAQTVKELEGRYVPMSPNNRFGWDDFIDMFTPEDQTWGLGYSYSKLFPLTLSANITYSCLSIVSELGINLDGKEYTANQYNPIGYLTISPGFYCRFLSINCGIGVMNCSYMKTITTWGDDVYVDDSTTVTIGGSFSISADKYYFMLKPSITGYIPISYEEFYITINAGYNYIPKLRELNGWSFGVGFQWVY